MRALDRARHHVARRQVEVLALVAREMLVLEHAEDGFHRLPADIASNSGIEAQSLYHIGRGAAPGAELAAAVAEHVERGDALGDVEGIVAGHEHDGISQADPARALAERGQDHVRRRAVADLGIEMLLGDPEMVEAHLLGGDRLVEGMPERVALRGLDPRSRYLEMRHQSEFHRRDPPCDPGSPGRVDDANASPGGLLRPRHKTYK